MKLSTFAIALTLCCCHNLAKDVVLKPIRQHETHLLLLLKWFWSALRLIVKGFNAEEFSASVRCNGNHFACLHVQKQQGTENAKTVALVAKNKMFVTGLSEALSVGKEAALAIWFGR